jgi:uncharacterized protein (TIGR03000 family)
VAQIVLGGGHVIIGPPVGMSPRTDTGQANYPGGNGFVPGYGFYPYYSNDPDRPPVFGHLRKHAAPPPDVAPPAEPDAGPAPGCAVLRLRVPADAEVWFGGTPTVQRGPERHFVTPPLELGRAGYYEVRVRWQEAGRPQERTELVPVYAGDRRTVDFLAPSRPERLPRPAGE